MPLMTVARGVVCVVGVLLACTAFLARKLGQWTSRVERANQSVLRVLDTVFVFADRRRRSLDTTVNTRAINHAAQFCHEDDDPPTEASA